MECASYFFPKVTGYFPITNELLMLLYSNCTELTRANYVDCFRNGWSECIH